MTLASNPSATTADTFLLGGETSVRRLGLGTMRLTDSTGDGTHAGAQIWRAPTDPFAAISLLRRAVELGAQLIDTADAYALGEGEELVARALHPYRDDLIIATKVGIVRPTPTDWVPLGHPAYLKQQVELSLRRLRLDRIDLLQLHRLDPGFPIADQVGALSELRQEGKIRHIGLSEVSVSELEEARQTAPIASVQNLYNLEARDHDAVVEYTSAAGIAFLPFFPLAVGDLARQGSAVASIADELGATPSQVALAWLLHRSLNILPIPGTSSTAHLEQNLGSSDLTLTDAQCQRLGDASPTASPS